MVRSPLRGVAAAAAALALTLGCASAANADTFNVNTTDDNSDPCAAASCSLRGAFDAANNNPGPDTINIAAGHYVREPGNFGIDVEDDVTVVGAGKGQTFIDADGHDRIFRVRGVSMTMSGVTLEGGSPDCGECTTSGGAIALELNSALTLSDSRITHNRAWHGNGGAIFSQSSTVSLTRVEIDHNLADGNDDMDQFVVNGGGGAIAAANSSLTIADSWIHDNTTATGDGGGILNTWETTQEPPTCDAADIAICSIVRLASHAAAAAAGEPVKGDLSISGTTIADNNAADNGGGIANYNTLSQQPGLAPGNGDATQSIVNSTISGNIANVNGVYRQQPEEEFAPSGNSAGGGGIFNAGTTSLALTNDTIVGNQIPTGNGKDESGGAGIASFSGINFQNTLLAGNRRDGGLENCAGDGFNSLGNNLESGDTCNLSQSSDQTKTDPKIGSLRDNGGFAPTHALLDGSPAIDKASNDAGPGTDERGGYRPPAAGSSGSVRDIGAYEAYSLADLSIEAKGSAAAVTAGQPLTYTVVARNDGPDKINGVTVSDQVPTGTALVSATTDKSGATCDNAVNCNLGTLDVNEVVKITIVVTPAAAGSVSNTATISAAKYTETAPGNDSKSVSTTVNAVVIPPQQTPQDTTPDNPQKPRDKSIELNIKAPKIVDLDTFFNGITVSADCGDEECLRKFREHAAVNTGATHIAGFNLTIERTSLGFKSKKTKVKLKPCVSGSQNGRAHKRCVENLRKATEKAVPFRVKVVVSAVDHSGNHLAKKAFIKVVK